MNYDEKHKFKVTHLLLLTIVDITHQFNANYLFFSQYVIIISVFLFHSGGSKFVI